MIISVQAWKHLHSDIWVALFWLNVFKSLSSPKLPKSCQRQEERDPKTASCLDWRAHISASICLFAYLSRKTTAGEADAAHLHLQIHNQTLIDLDYLDDVCFKSSAQTKLNTPKFKTNFKKWPLLFFPHYGFCSSCFYSLLLVLLLNWNHVSVWLHLESVNLMKRHINLNYKFSCQTCGQLEMWHLWMIWIFWTALTNKPNHGSRVAETTEPKNKGEELSSSNCQTCTKDRREKPHTVCHYIHCVLKQWCHY